MGVGFGGGGGVEGRVREGGGGEPEKGGVVYDAGEGVSMYFMAGERRVGG